MVEHLVSADARQRRSGNLLDPEAMLGTLLQARPCWSMADWRPMSQRALPGDAAQRLVRTAEVI